MEQFANEWTVVLFCGFPVLLWALIRPSAVRDADERKLPWNLTARVFVIFLYLVAYLTLFGALHYAAVAFPAGLQQSGLLGTAPSPNFNDLLAGWSPLKNLNLKAIAAARAPFWSVSLLASLMALRPCREVETRFLIWTHGAAAYHAKAAALGRHLLRCGYEPTDEERGRNKTFAAHFNLEITDDKTSLLNLEAVQLWRKTSILLKLIEEWNEGEQRVLNQREMRQLETIRHAHERKTRLAADIVGLMMKGHSLGEALMKAQSDMFATGTEALETPLPVRISSTELHKHLQQINGYFVAEYKTLLGILAPLAAKSVVRAGDAAPARLKQMKTDGFKGSGASIRWALKASFGSSYWSAWAIS